jgi:outer membrane protein OmpA-like peptidoglycan-associated protein
MSSRALAFALVVLGAAAAARAAETAAIDAQQFHPALTSHGYLAVDGAFVAPHLGFSVGLTLGYAHDPLVARDARDTEYRLIGHQLGGDFGASFALVNRLELGVALPFVYQRANLAGTGLGTPASVGLGDLRLELKGLLWAPRVGPHQFGLALIIGGSAPTGDDRAFMSQGAVTGVARLVVEWRSRWASLAINFGGVGRTRRDFHDLYVTSQLSWGVGLGVPLPVGLALLGEVRGLIGVGLPRGASLTLAEAPTELAAGLRWRARFGLELVVAGGAGLTRGYGTPDGRVVFGLRYVTPDRAPPPPPRLDADGDGLNDDADTCPSQPGPAANRGCPDFDSDGDGVVDRLDQCAHDPGLPANHGCPERDGDGDGISDAADKCPEVRGVPELGGCPLPDRDKDGIADDRDRCPDRAGSAENNGCPDFDSDGDGIVDRLDKCPFDAEIFNGVTDDDGCPDMPLGLAVFNGDRIALLTEQVAFVDEGSVIDPRSYQLLGVVAHIINLHPEVLKLRIEGHVDGKGGRALEQLELSRARAAAVRRWLIDHGHVDGKRLTAQGFGAGKPESSGRAPSPAPARKSGARIEIVVMQKLDVGP